MRNIKNKIKENKFSIAFCVLFAILGLFSFYTDSIMVGHDLKFHLNRFIGLAKAFEEGQILPKIYPYTNNGFGYASPLFYCDLFLYPFGILNHFGVPAVYCYKLCVFTYTLIGNLIVYFILKKETNRNDISLIGVLLYFSANYHLQNIFIRNALGEILAMTFIPLVLHSIYKILVKYEDCYIYLGVSFSLLVMSHLITTLLYGIFFFCMIIVFIVINRKDKQLLINTFKTILKGTLLALLLTAWYLLPMLEQLHSQTFWLSINAKYDTIFKTTTSNLFDAFHLSSKDFVPSSGIVLIILALGSFFVCENKYNKTTVLFCILLYLIMFGVIPGNFLKIIQFYYRLYSLIFPLFCASSVLLIYKINRGKALIIVAILAVFYSVFNICASNMDNLNSDNEYLNNNSTHNEINGVCLNQTTTYNINEISGAEYLPYTEYVNYNTDSLCIKIIDEYEDLQDYVFDYDRKFTEIIFSCDNNDSKYLLLPLSWYKGYKAYELIDGVYVEKEVLCNEKYKEVMLKSEKGPHTYKVVYKGTNTQKISLIVSSVAVICTVYLAYKRKQSNVI